MISPPTISGLLQLCAEAGFAVSNASDLKNLSDSKNLDGSQNSSSAQNTLQNVKLTGITSNSKAVKPGELFCCIRGSRHDGHDFAKSAVQAGAVALVCEQPLGLGVPEVIVENTRNAIARLSSAFYNNPSSRTDVIGITGTNGKTSVGIMLEHILKEAGEKVTLIGTLSGKYTTPEAPNLQKLIAESADAGAKVVMEVSSHGISQQRVSDTRFAVCAFSNLTPEHLDYHITMEEYFQTKQALFTSAYTHRAVIFEGDDYARRLIRELPEEIALRRCSSADVEVTETGLEGVRFIWQDTEMYLPHIGEAALENAVLAVNLAQDLGVEKAVIQKALASMPQIPGRFEVVRQEPVTLIVDYAHTPSALEKTLSSARQLAARRVIAVFGCGGERDRKKRPLMGKVAAEGADHFILTNDNARSELPHQIISEIISGIPAETSWQIETDRARAIGLAMDEASPGDLVVVAGKGHETYQIVAGHASDFNDRVVVAQEADKRTGIRHQPLRHD